jgi:8-oxo-dGTP pyrophosphatase MutT (NUDIX family)
LSIPEKPSEGSPADELARDSTPHADGGPPSQSPRYQVCAIPYRWEAGELRYLVVTSSAGDRWIFPKGVVDPGFTAEESAHVEAFEEAGARGNLSPTPLHSYPRKKWGHDWTVLVFALECVEVADDWSESYRSRMWVTYGEAKELLGRDERKSLRAVRRQLLIQGRDEAEP